MQVIERRPIKEILSERILDGTVNAALFSTYTFSRPYFEDEVLTGFLCERGLKRGRSPITVLMDQEMYEGSGWGYDVHLYRGGRLWHPKMTALMVTEQGWGARPKTIFIVGSGNLTLSGWETNLELALVLDWGGWTLPKVIENWISHRNSFASNSYFGRWYQKASEERPRKYVEEQLLSSFDKLNIWEQWGWGGGYWSSAHVLAPFMDSPEDEGSSETTDSYLRTLVKFAVPNGRLHLYLNGAPDERAYGNWHMLKKLSKEIELKTFRARGENLHAKLQAIKAEGAWQILGGSPNPTANALLKDPRKRGNVELAWQTTCASLGGGLLPPHDEIALKRWNFVMPPSKRKLKRWRAISRLRYNPSKKKLFASWISPHSANDTRVLLAKADVEIDEKVILGEDRAVQTLPRDPGQFRGFDPDWVPIEFPSDESDDPVLERKWSLEQILSLLGRREISVEGLGQAEAHSGNLDKDRVRSEDSEMVFPWHDKVSSLEETLANMTEAIEGLQLQRDAAYWLGLVERVFEASNPDEAGITVFESSWRDWVRARVCDSLLNQDKRRRFTSEFVAVAMRWRRHVDWSLRKADGN